MTTDLKFHLEAAETHFIILKHLGIRAGGGGESFLWT